MVEEQETVEETIEEDQAHNFIEEDMANVALNAISKLSISNLFDGITLVLIELYKVRPESYEYDSHNYEEPNAISPFVDLARYIRGDQENDSDTGD